MDGVNLFEINYYNGSRAKDLTNYIKVPSYKVNRQPIYTEWTDGDMIVHRETHRYKISGSFTLYFTNMDDLTDFLEKLEDSKTMEYKPDGTVDVNLYAVNEDKVYENVKVYMDFEMSDTIPLMGRSDYEGIEITITER